VVAWLGVALLAGVANAASVVDVRIGRHPTFTRVVFELDAPAGYRIQHEASEGTHAVLVTLEASSEVRQIDSPSLMVESVGIAEGLDQALARIVLRRPSPQLREMILAKPPRIVFDVMLNEEALAIAAPPKPAQEVAETTAVESPATTPAQPEPEKLAAEEPPAPLPEAESERVAVEEPPAAPPEPEPEKLAAEEPEAPPLEPESEKVVAEAPKAPPTEPVKAPAEEPPAEKEPAAVEKTVAPVEETPEPEAPALENLVPEEKRLAESATPIVPDEPPRALRPPGEQVQMPRSPPPPRRRSSSPKPSPAVPAAEEAPFDYVTVGAVAAGVLALFVILVVLMRRRSIPNDLDVAALAEEAGAEDGSAIPAEGFSMGEAPAEVSDWEDGEESIAEELQFEKAAEEPPPEPVPEEPPAEPVPEETPFEPAAEEPRLEEVDVNTEPDLFDETDKGDDEMDQDLENLPISRTEPIAATGEPSMSAGETDVARLVHELERRIEHLEARLDESVDARERLERQVAAQSEELRVQRAAIARTQRAVRSLSRSEDEQVTEPALREPGN
jgi:hypothetical protein